MRHGAPTIYDVAIVGAGPAGSSLAILLARSGYEVLLLEKAHFPRDKVCGDFVSPRALQLLAGLGCRDDIEALDALPIRTAEVVLDGELLSVTEIPDVGGIPGVGRAIPRCQLDDIIHRRACASGAVPVEGCRVLDFAHSGSGVRITAQADGAERRFRARMIVGADGALSTVARIAGLGHKDPRHTFSSMRGYLSGMPLDRATFFFSSDSFPGYAWVFPMSDGKANYGAGILAEASTRSGLRVRDFVRGVRSMLEERARAQDAEPIFGAEIGWPIKTIAVDAPRTFERGLLIGEAGGFVNPLNGEGIPLAIETASLAAEVIDDALRANDLGLESMRRFDDRWRGYCEVDLRIGDAVMSLIRSTELSGVWLTWFRALARRMASDPVYAAQVTGVLAGALPNRTLLRADVMAKSLLQDPGLWMELGQRTAELGVTAWRSVFDGGRPTPGLRADAGWWLGWVDDVVRTQIGAVDAFVRAPRRE